MSLSTKDLISSVRFKMMISKEEKPKSLSNDDIILCANEELFTLYPKICNVNKSIFRSKLTITDLNQCIIPADASLSTIDRIEDKNGNKVSSSLYEILDGKICFKEALALPLELYYQRSPRRLIKIEDSFKVTQINDDVISLNRPPLEWSEGEMISFFLSSSTRPYGSDIINEISGSDIHIRNCKTKPILNSIVCSFGETIFPELPQEFFTILAQKTAAMALAALGDQLASELVSKGIEEKTIDALSTLAQKSANKLPEFKPVEW